MNVSFIVSLDSEVCSKIQKLGLYFLPWFAVQANAQSCLFVGSGVLE